MHMGQEMVSSRSTSQNGCTCDMGGWGETGTECIHHLQTSTGSSVAGTRYNHMSGSGLCWTVPVWPQVSR